MWLVTVSLAAPSVVRPHSLTAHTVVTRDGPGARGLSRLILVEMVFVPGPRHILSVHIGSCGTGHSGRHRAGAITRPTRSHGATPRSLNRFARKGTSAGMSDCGLGRAHARAHRCIPLACRKTRHQPQRAFQAMRKKRQDHALCAMHSVPFMCLLSSLRDLPPSSVPVLPLARPRPSRRFSTSPPLHSSP